MIGNELKFVFFVQWIHTSEKVCHYSSAGRYLWYWIMIGMLEVVILSNSWQMIHHLVLL